MVELHYLQYRIKVEEEGRQVLAILRHELHLTTKKIRSVKYHEVGILLDGRRVTVRQEVRAGQLLEVLRNDVEEKADRVAPSDIEIDILYEDADLIFLNKQSGIVSHPSLGHSDDSLANGVKGYLLRTGENSRIHLVGRLDKDTSGILGIAKNSITKERMITARQEGQVQKEYIALVEGILTGQEGTVRIPMEEYRDEADGHKLKMRRASDIATQKEAVTHYRVIHQYEQYALVCLWLETGRMHQIRFHMSEIGHPLLGDPVYGKGHRQGMERTALHAYRVSFCHPYKEEKIEMLAPIPKDMETWIGSIEDYDFDLKR